MLSVAEHAKSVQNAASEYTCEICVVLPEPVSPMTMVTGLCLTAFTILSVYSRIGNVLGSI